MLKMTVFVATSRTQCREERRNLVRVTLAHIGRKAGDALASPKVLTPYLMGALGHLHS